MQLNLKPAHAKIREYFNALNQFGQLNISHETAVRQAFASLLDTCAKQFKWKLVQEFRVPIPQNKSIIVDGVVLDSFTLKHGYWEAKDLKDQLEKEIKKKLDSGYPKDNIIFQSPARAVLYQQGMRQGLNEDITSPNNLVELLKVFFQYREPQHEEWESAVADFSSRIPEIAGSVKSIIEKERKTNKKFVSNFEGFVQLCRQSVNPNLSEDTVETMLIQHLLTERIFRKVFNNPEFTRRNIVATEIEKVIDSLTSRHFSRDAFLKDLDRFYHAIEINAENATDYSEKQSFLNTVYERFFQGFSPKQADTHGIVYTPQPIVNFMVRSVDEILKREFSKSLSDKGVHILDPFVGTGNFIVRVMQEIKKTALPYKYANELHCNEVMLLPYYIASMNIEHAFLEATGEYKPFEGICLVDTFELAEESQAQLFTAENTVRVQKQKQSPIFVIIGNPPYNAWQVNQNDDNKNRKYPALDRRIAESYAKLSRATNKNSLSDPYIKAIRWASDRLSGDGIVAFVTNNGFLDSIAAEGMREHLENDFQTLYIFDLGGNVRKNPRLSGTTHNVFGIQVGVSIMLLIRKKGVVEKARIFYARMDEYWRKEQKYSALEDSGSIQHVLWQAAKPDKHHNWIPGDFHAEFDDLIPLAFKLHANKERNSEILAIFDVLSRGICSCRDAWVYNFDKRAVAVNIKMTADVYNSEVARWARLKPSTPVDEFVVHDEKRISWSRDLKADLQRGRFAEYSETKIRRALYRPFVREFLFLDKILNQDVHSFPRMYPIEKTEDQNRHIWIKMGSDWPMFALAANCVVDVLPQGGSQCFPFYIYDEDGSNPRENITDWALDHFRSHYKDESITKWDIFYYVYAVLHHPKYRKRYAADLKRELPHIPYAPEFHPFATAGNHLTELHVGYENQKEYPLKRLEKPGATLDLRADRMRLSKDRQSLVYNDFLTLTDIPKETYDYRLGNRSALEWVIDQYQVSTDKRSGITNDPNRADDPEYILRLIGQVITVSLDTMKTINALPDLGLPTKETMAQSDI